MFRRGFHSSVKAAERTRVWSDFSSRSKSLGINNVLVKKNVLEGSSAVKGGPVTIGRKSNRLKYNSPEHMCSGELYLSLLDFLPMVTGPPLTALEPSNTFFFTSTLLIPRDLDLLLKSLHTLVLSAALTLEWNPRLNIFNINKSPCSSCWKYYGFLSTITLRQDHLHYQFRKHYNYAFFSYTVWAWRVLQTKSFLVITIGLCRQSIVHYRLD